VTIETIQCIGDGWGKPRGMEGPEHYWKRGDGEFRTHWKAVCGMEIIEATDEFGGLPIVEMTRERNPLEQNRCELCLAVQSAT